MYDKTGVILLNDKKRLEAQKAQFEQLYREHCQSLLRMALSRMKNYTSLELYTAGRAEEAVQETFSIAWEKRDDFLASPAPLGWLIRALDFKIKELLRDEHTWRKRLLRFSEQATGHGQEDDFQLRSEMLSVISEEEYALLKQLYLDGSTYKELSELLGIKQSTLAMRVKRIKERVCQALKDEKSF